MAIGQRGLYVNDGMTRVAHQKWANAQRKAVLAQKAAVARARTRWNLQLYYDGVLLANYLVSGGKKEAMNKAEKVVAARPASTIGKLTNYHNPSNVAAWKSLRSPGGARGRTLFTKRTLRLV